MSGEDLILKARERYPDQRHIIYTGSISYNLSDKLLALGMRPEHVFLKPIRVLTLLVKCVKTLANESEESTA
jgi:hypothetical protein